MKKLFKSRTAFLVAVTLLITVTVGSSLALLIAATPALRNFFIPPNVSCQTTYDEETDTWTVTNDGDADIFVRVAVVPNLTNENGDIFWSNPPCTVACEQEKWVALGEHGYYYYNEPLPAGKSVSFGTIDVDNTVGAAFGFDTVDVTVTADALQVGSADALADAWGVSYTKGSGFTTAN